MKPRGRPCLACRDARRADLDTALSTGENNCAVSRRFPPLSRDTIRVHRRHLSQALVRHADIVEAVLTVRAVDKGMARLDALDAHTEAARATLSAEGDHRGALTAIQTAAGLWKLRREMTPAPGPAGSAGGIEVPRDELAERIRAILDAESDEDAVAIAARFDEPPDSSGSVPPSRDDS